MGMSGTRELTVRASHVGKCIHTHVSPSPVLAPSLPLPDPHSSPPALHSSSTGPLPRAAHAGRPPSSSGRLVKNIG
eukprot:2620989-Pyramimonas_sp.AAC.1